METAQSKAHWSKSKSFYSSLWTWFKLRTYHGDICAFFTDGCGETVLETITDSYHCSKITISWLCVAFLQFFMPFFWMSSFICFPWLLSGSYSLSLSPFFLFFFFLSQDKAITYTIRCGTLFWNVPSQTFNWDFFFFFILLNKIYIRRLETGVLHLWQPEE